MSPIGGQYNGRLAGYPGTSQITMDQRVHLPVTDSPFLPRPIEPQRVCNINDRLPSTSHAEKAPVDLCIDTPNRSNISPEGHALSSKVQGLRNKSNLEMEEVHSIDQMASCSTSQTDTSASPRNLDRGSSVSDSCVQVTKTTCNSADFCESIPTILGANTGELSPQPDKLYNLDAPSLCTLDIINQAVTAAISEKGLVLNSLGPL